METPLEDILARIYQEQDESDLFDESCLAWCAGSADYETRPEAAKVTAD